ncbi:MAG: hypothetical protein WB723_04200 [Candidatus Acidiferrales bacterium]
MIGERLHNSAFLVRMLQEYHERLAASSSLRTTEVDQDAVLQKLELLRNKKGRILDAFFEGVIDRGQRDEALGGVEREMCAYDELLGRSSANSQPLPILNLDSLVRVIEPLADWEFLGRDDRRALLRRLCPEISIYQYKIKSLTLNLGASDAQLQGRDKGSRSKTVA